MCKYLSKEGFKPWTMEVYVNFIAVLVFFSAASSQSNYLVYPDSYEVSSNVISESGSSETGNCSNVTDSGRVCNSPRSSVLFDGIPTLTELDGDMWARQLLTFNTSTSPASITFNFTTTSDTDGQTINISLSMIEVHLFICSTIEDENASIEVIAGNIATNIIHDNSSLTFCSPLVKIWENNFQNISKIITLIFNNLADFIYIAEIAFYSERSHQNSSAEPINSSLVTTTPFKLTSETTQLHIATTDYEPTKTFMSFINSTTTTMDFKEINVKWIAVGTCLSFIIGVILGIMVRTCVAYGVCKKCHSNEREKSKTHTTSVKLQSELSVMSDGGIYDDVVQLRESTIVDNLKPPGKTPKVLQHMPVSSTETYVEVDGESSIPKYVELSLQINDAYGSMP